MSSLPLLVVTALLAISFRGCTACKCVALSDESKICLSDFVISGTLLETHHPNSTTGQYAHDTRITYRVSVGKVYRSSRSLPKPLTITTEGHTCGVTGLQINATYFIAGQFHDEMYEINRCSSVVAEYGPDDIPYRPPNVKVNVNVTCPVEGGDDVGQGGSAIILTSNVYLLAILVLCVGTLKMF